MTDYFDIYILSCYKTNMENIIDFPWYRAYDSTRLNHAEQRLHQKRLFCDNFLRQSKLILFELSKAKFKPSTLIRIVEEESPSTTRYTDRCWIITQEMTTKRSALKIGSKEPPTEFTSFQGLAITADNTLLQYGALENHIKNNEVLHINGKHLFNEIPDEYIDIGSTASMELILGLAKLSLISI